MWFNVEWDYHRSADEAWNELVTARRQGANLLLNTGLEADGSIHPVDAETLKGMGQRLRENSMP